MTKPQVLSEELLAALHEAVSPGSTITTLANSKPNFIAGISKEGVLIETQRSRQMGLPAQLVPAWMLEAAWRHLRRHRLLKQTELLAGDGLKVKRSAAVMALLARLPGIEVASVRPNALRLKP